MGTKNIQLSTRVTDEDAAFLARLEIDGAETPSDKIRALIGEARRRHEGKRDFRTALQRVSDLLAPVEADVRLAEHATRSHSELIRITSDWLAETIAFLVSQGQEEPGGVKKNNALLDATERGLADRVFRLMEAILRLGVTGEAPCYNRAAISERLGPILELLEVIRAARARGAAGR
jgi:hypothetical protein